jgi:hypothetical protein
MVKFVGKTIGIIVPQLCLPFWPWPPWVKWHEQDHGSLTEGEGSVRLTSLCRLVKIAYLILFTFLQNKLPKRGGQPY